MDFSAPAIVVAVLPHGEHGAVVSFLTAEHGLTAGYVPGGRSRANRPILQPGNSVSLRLRTRPASTLGSASVELMRSRTTLATGRATAVALGYMTALLATVLDEGVAQPRLYAALEAVLDVMMLADISTWSPGLVRLELLLLTELGFGLDLTSCVATGAAGDRSDLAFVSPKSSHAVSRAAGTPFAAKLLPLPTFLMTGGPASTAEIIDGFRTTGWFLDRDVLGLHPRLHEARAQVLAVIGHTRRG